eukprot:TRINITY_DN32226_c0_g1_i1.p1 TRINITY_DN32226_c0_g1~~TRINITY_DN32226_c0_g1_i1.p1  ORF type:complete len:1694 (-),score=362.69 TRINITY_DN32226_c0_g1_i1:46-5127(-)
MAFVASVALPAEGHAFVGALAPRCRHGRRHDLLPPALGDRPAELADDVWRREQSAPCWTRPRAKKRNAVANEDEENEFPFLRGHAQLALCGAAGALAVGLLRRRRQRRSLLASHRTTCLLVRHAAGHSCLTNAQIEGGLDALREKLGMIYNVNFKTNSDGKVTCGLSWDVDPDVMEPYEGSKGAVYEADSDKASAKARAGEQMLTLLGHVAKLGKSSRTQIKKLLDRLKENRKGHHRKIPANAIKLVEELDPHSSGWRWHVFLPRTIRFLLANGYEKGLSSLLDAVEQNFEAFGGAPAGIWEALLDEAVVAFHHHGLAAMTIERLAKMRLNDCSVAPDHGAQAYFQRFRTLLALEQLGAVTEAVRHHKMNPADSKEAVVSSVSHHGERQAITLTFETPSGSQAALGDFAVQESSVILLSPVQATAPKGGKAAVEWTHPESWLGLLTNMETTSNGVVLTVQRISHFSAEAFPKDSGEGRTEDEPTITDGQRFSACSVASGTSFRRMLSAVRSLCQVRLPYWAAGFEGYMADFGFSEAIENVLQGSRADAIAAADAAPEDVYSQDNKRSSKGSWTSFEKKLQEARPALFKSLNEEQLKAVQMATSKSVTLVQGAAGTGKTQTACGILAAWLAKPGHPGEKILAVADTDAAADNLHERLRAAGIESVRLGAEKAEDAEAAQEAEVVTTTCIFSGSPAVSQFTYSKALIEDSTQSCEPAVLVALGHGCEQVAMLGDPQAFSPQVVSEKALAGGLGQSMFERLRVHSGLPVVKLVGQHRMHASIAEFPKQEFYDFDLKTLIQGQKKVAGFPWLGSQDRVCFVDLQALPEKKTARQRKLRKKAEEAAASASSPEEEAAVVAQLVGIATNDGLDVEDLVVLTASPREQSLMRSAIDNHIADGQRVEVSTLAAYQGRERDVVFFRIPSPSEPRSIYDEALAFLRDPQKMTVMLTRARRGLVVIGKSGEVRGEAQHWERWLRWMADQKAVFACSIEKDGTLKLPPPPTVPTQANCDQPNTMTTVLLDDESKKLLQATATDLPPGWEVECNRMDICRGTLDTPQAKDGSKISAHTLERLGRLEEGQNVDLTVESAGFGRKTRVVGVSGCPAAVPDQRIVIARAPTQDANDFEVLGDDVWRELPPQYQIRLRGRVAYVNAQGEEISGAAAKQLLAKGSRPRPKTADEVEEHGVLGVFIGTVERNPKHGYVIVSDDLRNKGYDVIPLSHGKYKSGDIVVFKPFFTDATQQQLEYTDIRPAKAHERKRMVVGPDSAAGTRKRVFHEREESEREATFADKISEERRAELEDTLQKFKESGEGLYEFPPTLLGLERLFVHNRAVRLGLLSKSFGIFDGRHLCVFKTEADLAAMAATDVNSDDERHLATIAMIFDANTQNLLRDYIQELEVPHNWNVLSKYMYICSGSPAEPRAIGGRTVSEESRREIQMLEVGQEARLRAVAKGNFDGGFTLKVEGTPSVHATPQVVLATAPDARIFLEKPVEVSHWEPLPEDQRFQLYGQVISMTREPQPTNTGPSPSASSVSSATMAAAPRQNEDVANAADVAQAQDRRTAGARPRPSSRGGKGSGKGRDRRAGRQQTDDSWTSFPFDNTTASSAKGHVPVEGERAYLVDNSSHRMETAGLHFRSEKSLNAKRNRAVRWGSIVRGVCDGDGWLRVGEEYLPLSYNGKPLLTLVKDDAELPGDHSDD